jgi:hypothetical protein
MFFWFITMLHHHTADLDYSIEQQNRTLRRLRILTDKNRIDLSLFSQECFIDLSNSTAGLMMMIILCAHMSVSVSILLSICDISY